MLFNVFLFLLGQCLPFHFSSDVDLFSELEIMIIGMVAAKTQRGVRGKQFGGAWNKT